MANKTKKKIELNPKFVDWPPVGLGKMLASPKLPEKHILAEQCFDRICLMYPDFVDVWDMLFSDVDKNTLPLFIGRDLPDFVRSKMEQRFKGGADA